MNVLLLTGAEHGFDRVAEAITEAVESVCDLRVTDRKDVLASLSREAPRLDAVIFGTGFSRRRPAPSEWYDYEDALTPAQQDGLLSFVRAGGGFIGVHLAGWYVGGEPLRMLGGHANWHPPQGRFEVEVLDREHPITRGLSGFSFHGEAYMAAWQPGVDLLATTPMLGRDHPLLWTNRYGEGRVFYCAIGHNAESLRVPELATIFRRAVPWVCAPAEST